MAASPTLADPARAKARVCPGRPVFYAKNEADAFDEACLRGEPRRGQVRSDSPIIYGIERQDYSKNLGLLCRASLALSERVSAYSALRALEHGG